MGRGRIEMPLLPAASVATHETLTGLPSVAVSTVADAFRLFNPAGLVAVARLQVILVIGLPTDELAVTVPVTGPLYQPPVPFGGSGKDSATNGEVISS